jgi:hypothetical protein
LSWCQESYKPYPQGQQTSDDKEDELVVVDTVTRVLHGGGFGNFVRSVRSARRLGLLPSVRDGRDGFRPARTLVP